MEKQMQITSKSGVKVCITISGTQEEPIIVADEFTVRGRKIGGKAVIQNWKRDGVEEGLYFDNGDVYLQCAAEMPRIRAAIAELPHKRYFARKSIEQINIDGYRIDVQKWMFDKIPRRADGMPIGETEMGMFLDKHGIAEIEIADAEKLWNECHDLVAIQTIEAEASRRAQAIFDDDAADQGYKQACENDGLPRWMYRGYKNEK